MTHARLGCILLASTLLFGAGVGQVAADSTPITEVLVITGTGKGGRSPIQIDPIQYAIVSGEWKTPHEGDTVMGEDALPRTWTAQHAGASGEFEGDAFAGGYALARVRSDTSRVALLRASGHSLVYVNGEVRMGDPYSFGFMELPIQLNTGDNELLFVCGRGRLKASIEDRPNPVAWFNTGDVTAPDLLATRAPADAEGTLWFSLPVMNGTNDWLRDLRVSVTFAGASLECLVPGIPPLGSIKPALQLPLVAGPGGGDATVDIALLRGADTLSSTTLSLRVLEPDAKRKVTSVSSVDDSVQYYAVVPPIGWTPDADVAPDARPGLLLSLHGASVEATSQARCYAPRADVAVACATNRRPYGFDWEDWGRIDAIDVRTHANALFNTDPRRQWLTGHSMGGHGTMIVGAQRPDLFASIGPSAGWIDFWSYTGSPSIPVDSSLGLLLHTAQNSSRTLLLKDNYLGERVYVLHGDGDDNVPVAQSRILRGVLGGFHPDFTYFEQPGAGHWWGDQCVDWPPMIDALTAKSLPEPDAVTSGAFTTVSSAIFAGSHGVTVMQHVEPMVPARVVWSITAATTDAPTTITVTTQNVALLSLDTDFDGGDGSEEIRIDINGKSITVPEREGGARTMLSASAGGAWSLARLGADWDQSNKHPGRMGPFKAAVDNGVLLVCATGGDTAHNAWALAKARYDSEQFWYRGNGRLPVMTDEAYLAWRARTPLDAHADRNVILYGRADSNKAWGALARRAPLHVERSQISLEDSGGEADSALTFEGNESLLLAILPGPDSARQSIGLVAPAGPAAEGLSMRLPYFVAGVHYPDWSVIGSQSLIHGLQGWGGAGWCRGDWSIDLRGN
ncbi:MAG: prolyl oligopeptidase family serine peptidase [Planctomycetota bacterium]|nr:prolyl oligopeptidase family serine peptidase [Planctomycetota bacterium]MDA1105430.1 prolyl oligopeptidase family serine peptidase [Planctomycetota bacterium]